MKKINTSVLIASLLLLNSEPITATEPLTPDRYVRLEMSVRQAALEGAKARLDQLESADTSASANDLSGHTHKAISGIYREAGISPGAALVWENRNRSAINTWFEQHPDIHRQYLNLTEELNYLSARIDEIHKR